MFCESCGSKLGKAAKFCASCGNPVELQETRSWDELIEVARELIENLEWSEALETLWTEINSGNEEARIALAKLFDDNSLHSFSQDHWVFLLENSSSEWVRDVAATGVAQNEIFTWNINRAASIAEEFEIFGAVNDKIQTVKDNQNIEDFDPQEVATELDNMASEEATLLEKLGKKYKLDDQLELIRLRDTMANIAARVSFASRTYQGVSVTTGFGVPRRLKDLIPIPADSWYFLADAIAIALPDLVDSKRKKDQENLEAMRKLGLHALNNMFLLRGTHSLEAEREQFVVQNIAGALGQAGHFSGFMLAGLIPDEA